MVHNFSVIKQRIHQNSNGLIKDRDIYLKPHLQEMIFLNFLASNAESTNSFHWNSFSTGVLTYHLQQSFHFIGDNDTHKTDIQSSRY